MYISTVFELSCQFMWSLKAVLMQESKDSLQNLLPFEEGFRGSLSVCQRYFLLRSKLEWGVRFLSFFNPLRPENQTSFLHISTMYINISYMQMLEDLMKIQTASSEVTPFIFETCCKSGFKSPPYLIYDVINISFYILPVF